MLSLASLCCQHFHHPHPTASLLCSGLRLSLPCPPVLTLSVPVPSRAPSDPGAAATTLLEPWHRQVRAELPPQHSTLIKNYPPRLIAVIILFYPAIVSLKPVKQCKDKL